MQAAVAGLILLALCAAPAAAGPWGRERGGGFASVSRTGDDSSLWVEYGLGRRLTLLADVGGSGHARHGALMLHREFGAPGRNQRFAATLGVAAGPDGRGGREAGLRVGLSLGAGIGGFDPAGAAQRLPLLGTPLRKGLARIGIDGPVPGWVALDTHAEAGRNHRRMKAEATLGLKPHPRLMTVFQLQGEAVRRPWGAARSLHAQPSVVWQARDGLHLELGLRQRLDGQGARQLRLGSWLEF
ncbi:MAG: hypothetical protein ACK4KW_10845 [Gemmobacter sp.]